MACRLESTLGFLRFPSLPALQVFVVLILQRNCNHLLTRGGCACLPPSSSVNSVSPSAPRSFVCIENIVSAEPKPNPHHLDSGVCVEIENMISRSRSG